MNELDPKTLCGHYKIEVNSTRNQVRFVVQPGDEVGEQWLLRLQAYFVHLVEMRAHEDGVLKYDPLLKAHDAGRKFSVEYNGAMATKLPVPEYPLWYDENLAGKIEAFHQGMHQEQNRFRRDEPEEKN